MVDALIRIALGFLLGLGLVWLFMPRYIHFLKKLSFNQTVSEYSLEQYKEKAQTPIMGGVLFVWVPVILTLLLYPSSLFHLSTMIVLLAFVGYSLIGFLDDYIIVVRQDNTGLRPKVKFLLQLILAVVFFFAYRSQANLDVSIPFIKVVWSLGPFYALFCFVMFTGMSNAVNLTDGMDGLAGGCSAIAFVPFLAFCLYQQQFELAVFVASLIGSLLAYLHYNNFPARIFMGDVGSLGLGGAFAALAMVLKCELAMVVVCGVFIWETLCVVIQIGSVKLFGKRVFRYTPIHYSFVIGGMSEKRVVHSFWILAAICATVGLFAGLI